MNFLFGKPKTLDHPFFGLMITRDSGRNAGSIYFECARHFAPSGKSIQIGIQLHPNGSTQRQIDFFKNIEENYAAIVQTITPLIEDEFGNWKEGFKIKDFQKEFEPVFLAIPLCDLSPILWEIVFESEHDRNHNCSVSMSNFDATELLIDG